MNKQEIENLRKAGKIASETVKYARSIIKQGMKLLDIAEKIEAKIIELGGKPAFPVNLSIDDIAAHYTPSYNDENVAEGLLKVDIGVHVQGQIADTAFSLNLSGSKENEKLIEASEKALHQAIKTAGKGIEIWKIGKAIQDEIESLHFSPIRNLCGHELANYKVHAGLTIPNCNNRSDVKLHEGVYAIEPFSTTGIGMVYDGKPSGIYRLEARKAIRDSLARQILNFIEEEYKTLPFCERWIVNKFGKRALLSLHLLEQEKILHQFPQLIEKNHSPVSQAEHTILVNEKIEIITE